MKGYNLNNFLTGKAFIYFNGVINGKSDYGPRICINTKGEKLFELPDKNMMVNEFEDENVAFVSNNNNKKALMNDNGIFLTDFIYDNIYGGSKEGLFEVQRDQKHGHIDLQGKEIIPCIYDKCNYFSEGIAAECLNEKWGMIDYFNNTVIPFEYEYIGICKNNLISVKKNRKWGFINKSNEVIVDFNYDFIDYWTEGECLVFPASIKNDKWGLIDRYGQTVLDFNYDEIVCISDYENNSGKHFKIKQNDKYAIYSAVEQSFLSGFVYDNVGSYSEGLISVKEKNKCGLVDLSQNYIVPPKYDYVREIFFEGLMLVVKDGKYGAINSTGDLVIPCYYKILNNCSEGLLCAINYNNDTGFIDKENDVIIPFGKFINKSFGFNDGYAVVRNKEQEDLYINKTGKILEIKL